MLYVLTDGLIWVLKSVLMKDINELLIYAPNKSNSYGQAVYPKEIGKALDQIDFFLEKYANYEVFGTIDINLQLSFNHDSTIETLIENITQTFGQVDDTMEPSEKNSCGYAIWKITSSEIDRVKSFVLSNKKTFKSVNKGRILISINYLFKWKSNIIDSNKIVSFDGDDLNCHDLQSMLTVYVEKNPFIQPLLIFPFSIEDKTNWKVLKTILEDCPFKVNFNNFKKQIKTKKSQSFLTRKISKELIEEFTCYN